jgi:hypothetical protein
MPNLGRWKASIAAMSILAVGVATSVASAQVTSNPSEYGPLTGYIQFGTGLKPNSTVNAQPACHPERRFLCLVAACVIAGARCLPGEVQIKVGNSAFCERQACP